MFFVRLKKEHRLFLPSNAIIFIHIKYNYINNKSNTKERILKHKISIAKILQAHGLKNQAVIFVYSGDFQLKNYSQYYILTASREFESLEIQSIKPVKNKQNSYIANFSQYSTRDDIEKFLVNSQIYVDELNYSSLKEEEFFYKDVYGANVWVEEDFLGKVVSVHNFGNHDILEIEINTEAEAETRAEKVKAKEKQKSVFFPVQKEFLLLFDLEKKTIIFKPEVRLLIV